MDPPSQESHAAGAVQAGGLRDRLMSGISTSPTTGTGTVLHGGVSPLAALTTIFSPPCPTSWLLTSTEPPSQFPVFPSAATGASSTCDPPFWAQNLASKAVLAYYSPAVCPSGFAVGPGCSGVGASLSHTPRGLPPLASGEQVAWCVPGGMTCTSDTSDFPGGVWGGSTQNPAPGLASGGASASGAAVKIGPAIQIRWVQADLLTLQAATPLVPGMSNLAPSTSSSLASSSTSALHLSSSPPQATPSFGNPTTLQASSAISSSAGPTNTDTSASSYPANGLGLQVGMHSGNFTIIIITVLITVLVSMSFWIAVLYRRYRAGKTRSPAPALVRLVVRRGRTYRYDDENPVCENPSVMSAAVPDIMPDGGRQKRYYGRRFSKVSTANMVVTPVDATPGAQSAGPVDLEAVGGVVTRSNLAEPDGQRVSDLDPERGGWAHMPRLLPRRLVARLTSVTRRSSPNHPPAPDVSESLSSTSMVPRSLSCDDDDAPELVGGLTARPGFTRVVITRHDHEGEDKEGARPKSAARWKSMLRLSSGVSWLSSSARPERPRRDYQDGLPAPPPLPPMPPMSMSMPSMPAAPWMLPETAPGASGICTSTSTVGSAAEGRDIGPSSQLHPLCVSRSTPDRSTIHSASGLYTPTVATARISRDTFGFQRNSVSSAASGAARSSPLGVGLEIPEVPGESHRPTTLSSDGRQQSKSGSGATGARQDRADD